MKNFKVLTLALLVLALCMTSVSAAAALNPAATYDDGIVNVTATGVAGAADATIIATRQNGNPDATPTFSAEEVLATIVYIDQAPAAADLNFSFAPARAEGDTVSVFMSGAGASAVERAYVSVAAAPVIRTLAFNTNGGTFAVAAPEEYTEAGLTLPVPAKAGYTFEGWYANAELTGPAVEAISAEEAAVGGAKEFWAKWGIETTSYTYDAGYVVKTIDEFTTENVGVISATAVYDQAIGTVEEYGFYVHRPVANDARITLSGTGDVKEFYTVVYGIPEECYDEPVCVLPYVKVGGKYYTAFAAPISVDKGSVARDLGFTFEQLEALFN